MMKILSQSTQLHKITQFTCYPRKIALPLQLVLKLEITKENAPLTLTGFTYIPHS